MLQLSSDAFMSIYPDVEISKISQIDQIVPNQLETRNSTKFQANNGELNVIYRDERINAILGIKSIVIT